MRKLIPLLTVSLILAFIVQHREKRRIGGVAAYDRAFTTVLILILGIFTGLRVWYNDTVTYLMMYQQTTNLSDFWTSNDFSFAGGLGFGFVNSLLKTMGASSQDFIMAYGLATMALYISALHRHSDSFPFTIFLFFVVGCFVFAQAAIKQSIAMAIGCWVYHFAVEKKWGKFASSVIIAALFHPYALIFLLLPLMQFRPWSIWGYLWVGACVMAGFGLERLFGTILDITSLMGARYDSETFKGEGVNIFRVMVCLVPTVISFIFQRQLYADAKREDYLLMNATMLNGLIMFVGLFGTANYFARLANYFLPLQTLALPWLANHFDKRSKPVFVTLCVGFYCAYFYYQSGILQPFDDEFAQTSLWGYLGGLIWS